MSKIPVVEPDAEKDFTLTKLVEYLNKKFEHKKSGKKFQLGDIPNYKNRGYLPREYGYHPLEKVVYASGAEVYRVHFDKLYKPLKNN